MIEVADLVQFELQAIDYVGLGSFLLCLGGGFAFVLLGFLGGFQFFWAGVAQDQDDAAAVGRPSKVVDVLRRLGEALSFSAAETEEPNLSLTLVALGEEGDGFAVGTPARVRGGDAFSGESDGVAASARDHPDAVFVLVRLEDSGFDGVGDPLGVGTQLGVVNGADLKIVVDGDGARSRSGLLGENDGNEYQNRKKNSKPRYKPHPRGLLSFVYECVEQMAKSITAPADRRRGGGNGEQRGASGRNDWRAVQKRNWQRRRKFHSNAFSCCMQERVLYSSDANSLCRGAESEDRLGGQE